MSHCWGYTVLMDLRMKRKHADVKVLGHVGLECCVVQSCCPTGILGKGWSIS